MELLGRLTCRNGERVSKRFPFPQMKRIPFHSGANALPRKNHPLGLQVSFIAIPSGISPLAPAWVGKDSDLVADLLWRLSCIVTSREKWFLSRRAERNRRGFAGEPAELQAVSHLAFSACNLCIEFPARCKSLESQRRVTASLSARTISYGCVIGPSL
jgi:hypothetical protein